MNVRCVEMRFLCVNESTNGKECAHSHELVNEKANVCMMKVVENILIDKSRICVVNHFCSK